MAGFVALLLIEPLRDFFEMLVFDPVYYVIIAAVTLLWAMVLRRAWRKNWFERFMRLDVPG